MEQISDYLWDHRDDALPPSQNRIENGVSGKAKYVRQAIDRLVREGYVEERRESNARRFVLLRRYSEADDEE